MVERHEVPFSNLPEIIQGGMGVGTSNWELAKAVAIAGEKLKRNVLGVVSGTGLPILMAERLRRKDPHTIEALLTFPDQKIANEILKTFLGSEKLPAKPQALLSKNESLRIKTNIIFMVANYVEVTLAKKGHNSPIGINYLEKVQMPHLPEIYGAMLAGVDYVLMGAGIPNQVPEVLTRFSNNESAVYKIDVEGSERHEMSFNPKDYLPESSQKKLKRPTFLAIVSSHVLAQALATKVQGINGFVVEGPIAGGHNAPPRGKEINEKGEPVYTEKDIADLAKIQSLGLPFWLAGGYTNPDKFNEAKQNGAAGIQVGTAFALSEDSGLDPKIKAQLKKQSLEGTLKIISSAIASPTGFPFQVAALDKTVANNEVYEKRQRVCTYGYLDKVAKDENGNFIYRCPSEPVGEFLKKGGKVEETEGRRCLCVGLAAAVNMARNNEPPVVTLGQDTDFLKNIKTSYGNYYAEEVIKYIFGN